MSTSRLIGCAASMLAALLFISGCGAAPAPAPAPSTTQAPVSTTQAPPSTSTLPFGTVEINGTPITCEDALALTQCPELFAESFTKYGSNLRTFTGSGSLGVFEDASYEFSLVAILGLTACETFNVGGSFESFVALAQQNYGTELAGLQAEDFRPLWNSADQRLCPVTG